MQVSGILETALSVSDPTVSAAFYRRLFGFDTLLDSDRLVALNVAGKDVLLLFKKGVTEEAAVVPGGVIPPHGASGRSHLGTLTSMSEVTQLLEAAQAGDRQAATELLPLVYNELRKLAAARMAAEAPGHTLDATALVHEAYLRLVGDQQFDGCGHFFAAASEAMRRILVDAARRKATARHGGQRRRRVDLDDLPRVVESPDGLCDLHDALIRFAAREPRKAKLVELRYFAGLSLAEAAAIIGVSRATAVRWWEFARLWLFADLQGEENSQPA
jgi:RNA polymerase sigma factor (TIGR02999 family)